MNKLMFPFITLLLFSCSSEAEPQLNEQQLRQTIREELREEMNNNSKNEDQGLNFNTNPSKVQPVSRISYEGSIITSRAWIDANGDNLAVFTKKGYEIYMFHYAFPNGVPVLKRKVQDFETGCEFDVTLEFIQNTIELTDLDNDNYGEISFLYKKACRSDVSPLEMKYLTIENGDKYIIRGSELMDYGDGDLYGGEMNIDASFQNGPPAFLSHAKGVWQRNNKVKVY
jgi:hypothetical protein